LFVLLLLCALFASCTPASVLATQVQIPTFIPITEPTETPVPVTTSPTAITGTAATASGFIAADGSRPLTFPADFGAHPDFRTEWWYYTGNLQTQEGRHFGFELTIFRVGLLPPTAEIPKDSKWSSREFYFAHFAVSDISRDDFYAFQRYSRPGPGLAGAEAKPYHVWLEDWNITEQSQGVYRLQAEQEKIFLNLTLTDQMGVILQGDNGYSRKGKNPANASYYYSQPRLRAEGSVKINGAEYQVNGLAWNDHEFSTGELDENQIGWDWFSLQFDDGRALMLFQLRERGGEISNSASGTFISAGKATQSLHKSDFEIDVLDKWKSPRTQGEYPSSWKLHILKPDCSLDAQPWMSDQEVSFPPITYWEGAVRFTGICDGAPVRGNGYIELTGYAGSLPMP
jgi:predicted secreted hydrolase